MGEQQYVPTNRTAEYFERMAKKTAHTKATAHVASLESDNFRRNIPVVLARVSEIRGGKWSQAKIARKITTRGETISRWKREGIGRHTSGTLERLCDLAAVQYDSLWDDELRFTEPTKSELLQVVTTDQKYQTLKHTGSWPIITALLDKLFDAEQGKRPGS